MSPLSRKLFEKNLEVRPELRLDVKFQAFTIEAVRQTGRKRMRKQLSAIEKRLFEEEVFVNFRKSIEAIFTI